MRSILVIGLGRFGRHLSMSLASMGNEVMAIDQNEKSVNQVAPFITAAHIGDCTDSVVLEEIGADNFDVCFVCISNDLESSLVITTLLKDMGASKVITKVNQDIHAKLLLHNGADDVIYPERDMARRAALKYSAQNAFDYIELDNGYGIFEIAPPKAWIGRSITSIGVRKHYGVNIIAYKQENQIKPIDREEYVFKNDQHLIVAGDLKHFHDLVQKKL